MLLSSNATSLYSIAHKIFIYKIFSVYLKRAFKDYRDPI
jgi:hypothetical protein